MTNPSEPDVMDLAVPYALHALSAEERDAVDTQVAQSGQASAFYDEVRAVREVMARLSATTAIEPPQHLRASVLSAALGDNVRTLPRRNWRQVVLAAAAAVVIGVGALGVGLALRPAQQPSTTEQIFAAPDVRTVSGELPGGGQATLVFSHERDAAYLVMNNVPPPSEGTVYQMWLLHDGQATSAGTMDAAAVSPSTTALVPDIGESTALAFTVEPGTGSDQPTSEPFASLPLS
ncbi:anti-sigma factor [Mycobacterium sp. MS1601]|uniref:anti-sigma factor n=1 Tax=Mycobacterium sp. MS1601 TaxID=1936029 RepID=UPI0009792BF1|nr:anti-sigma factor [Mycobacterium sp. MS1601]AQA02213.1 anti-sigma factor [Mycobacterium sp. MS1601]